LLRSVVRSVYSSFKCHSIDTDKLVGTAQQLPDGKAPKVQRIQYAFPDGGAIIRVVVEMRDPPARPPMLSRLEVVKPGMKNAEEVVAKTEKFISLIPAPNKQLVAARTVTVLKVASQKFVDKIIVLNNDGKVIKELVEEAQ
jgi:hypothetical protein